MQFAFAIVVVRVIVWLIARFIGAICVAAEGATRCRSWSTAGWIVVEAPCSLQDSFPRAPLGARLWAKTPFMAISVGVTTKYLVGWGNEQCGSQVELQRKCSNNPGPSH
jgi:hypothetical protein